MKNHTNLPRLKEAQVFHIPAYNAMVLEDYSEILVDYKQSASLNNINRVIKDIVIVKKTFNKTSSFYKYKGQKLNGIVFFFSLLSCSEW